MKNQILLFTFSIIIFLAVVSYLVLSKSYTHPAHIILHPSHAEPSPTPPAQCQTDQLTAAISSEGAAGNIYGTLTITNVGKTACSVVLGNTITARFDAKNIDIKYKQTNPPTNFILMPSAKVYSQVHYPNGPQCQSRIMEVPVTFLYQTDETSIQFEPNPETQKLFIQACSAPSEKTIIDIWPLSQKPNNP